MPVTNHDSPAVVADDDQSFYGRLLQCFCCSFINILHRDGVLIPPGFEFDEVRAGHSRALREAELLRRVAQCTFAEEGVAAPLLRGADHFFL